MNLEYPALTHEHVNGAKLFADRYDLVSSLKLPESPIIAEVGVAVGDFSEFLIKQFNPKKFVAFDIFTLHELAEVWGTPTKILFAGMTQLDFYRQRFAALADKMSTEVGDSKDTLAQQKKNSFDLIYIDARHDYEGVKMDLDLSVPLLTANGYLVFNDYTMYDPVVGGHYGVVPAVNQLIVRGGWKVVGFGLQRHMFCDIAICRT